MIPAILIVETPGGDAADAVACLEERGFKVKMASGAILAEAERQHQVTRLEREDLGYIIGKIAEVSPGTIGIYCMRPDGRVTMPYASPNTAEITGFDIEAVTRDATAAFPLIHPDDLPGHVESIAESARTLKPWRDEFRVRHPAKGEIWLEGRSIPERQPDGSIIWYGFLHDITALKEAERRLQESREQLRQLAAYRDADREEERKHIARELHDELGQFLSALRMQASMLRMRFGKDNAALNDHVNGMIQLVDDNIQVVRDIASALRPAMLDLGITTALEWLVQEFAGHSGIPCDLRVAEQADEMGEHCATTLFRVVQESLNNVMRHAAAGRVDIFLRRTDGRYRLEVKDDGKGFDPERVPKTSLGLVGMRERVLMLGGEIRISSAPGNGTALEVDIPACEAPAKRGV